MAHKTATEMVAEAKSRIENLSVEDVTSEVEQGDPILVDIRESEERAASGTIHGAVAAPRGMLEFWADPSSPYHREEFDPNKRTILYCASGGRSALATDGVRQHRPSRWWIYRLERGRTADRRRLIKE